MRGDAAAAPGAYLAFRGESRRGRAMVPLSLKLEPPVHRFGRPARSFRAVAIKFDQATRREASTSSYRRRAFNNCEPRNCPRRPDRRHDRRDRTSNALAGRRRLGARAYP